MKLDILNPLAVGFVLFHHQAREERLGDLNDTRLLFVGGLHSNKFVLTLPAMPKVLHFSRIDVFIPFDAN